MNSLKIIEKASLKLRNKIMEYCPNIDSMEDLVKRTLEFLGGKLVYPNMDNYEDIIGRLYVYSENNFLVKVSPFTSPIRDNYEIMREIGRYLFFYKKEMGEKSFIGGDSNTEIIVNCFASSFLMPRKYIKKAKKQYNGSISLIAAHFQVPTDIVKCRLESFR